ncbi:FAD binding domain-containing protein [Salinactinospora qingdaonensis]|uniref:Xanthine dehydrogenase family protein subunit M n=1 Tax=Salinactinospora qingdaonensis TaxID=702744 RepID=A0ABP7GD25_9ACTN
MIPPQFEYVKPNSVAEAVSALGESEEAKALAGGQSLLPLLRFRLAYPDVVVDLGELAELRGVRDEGDAVWIGAMTTHYDVVNDPVIAEHCELLAMATRTVADPAVRHRGTIGGSLSHADPAGDLPAVALALEAEFLISGPEGERTVAAPDFFEDYLTTTLEPEEILTGIRVPKWEGWSFHYEKFARTAQAWAIVGVAAGTRRREGEIAEARVGLTNMGPTPMRAHAVEEALVGVPAQAGSVRAASATADQGTAPPSDVNGQADYRRHLARVLTERALEQAAGI